MSDAVEKAAEAVCDASPLILNGFKPSVYSDEVRAKWRADATAIATAAIRAIDVDRVYTAMIAAAPPLEDTK